jgi:RND family efflux transporter MFP subunit
VQVTVAPAVSRIWAERDEVTGTVRARTVATVSAQVGGAITELRVEAGQAVKKGDVLAVLDVTAVRAQLGQAEAAKAQALAEKGKAEAERVRAQADLARYAKLLEQEAATRQEFESVRARARSAESAMAQAAAAVVQAEAKIAEVAAVLGYASVAAPFDGVVTAKLAQRGDLAQPGRPLVEVADPATLQLEALVPETVAARMTVGGEYEVALDGGRATTQAKVSEISPVADSASRTVLVKLPLPPECGAGLGSFGRLLVPAVGGTESVVVPEGAVLVRGQLEMVFVVGKEIGNSKLKIGENKGTRAVMRLVKVGGRRGGEAQILSGLKAGECVVVEGVEKLVDGQAVKNADSN